MRAFFLVTRVTVGLFMVACSAGAGSDAVSSSEAAETAPDPLVLVPQGFPRNSVGDCWTVSADRIQHETMFYWRGTPSELGGFAPHAPPSAVFTLDRTVDSGTTVRYEGTEIVSGRPARRVVVALTRVPDDPALAWWHQIGVDGSVTVSTPLASSPVSDEVVTIESGHPCSWSSACIVSSTEQ